MLDRYIFPYGAQGMADSKGNQLFDPCFV